MKRPLEDALLDAPGLSNIETRQDAEERLETLFLNAQGQSNAYAAERMQEVYEVVERAVALGSAFPVTEPEEHQSAAGWFMQLPSLFARYGSGLLLAGAAPLVADDSMILAVVCGVGAAVTLISRHRQDRPKRPLLPAKAAGAKFESLVSAADRTLSSMTAPRALPPAEAPSTQMAEDEMLGFLQDAVMASGSEEADELAANARRLIERAGYRVVREGGEELFEIMVDPELSGSMILKPALVHKKDSTKIIYGVRVRGQAA
ncbi:hypothetical protein HK107_00160 [Parvularcula sp. ZS-1/3]|uniref:Uncharacterized protein n=1 Tax=Parvularcula mediterranea TaxID=2732508 RepID=A0A7Y3RIL6_9PROT|nr:hypothetical protein [Parvularcula mediterranea]NNU14733.1 hypothetical protein [Parvularcula mediterranea]